MKNIIKELIKIAKMLVGEIKTINRQTDFFKKLSKEKVRNGRITYKDKDGYLYQWDELHGEWQMYNKNGNHLGVLDEFGNPIKEAIKGRKISL